MITDINTVQYDYMVCTRCMTYNQAKYIQTTMDGFTMQKTCFPMLFIIMDDASTDGEQEIINHYVEKNFLSPFRSEETEDFIMYCATHKENKHCIFSVYLLKYNHYGKKKKWSYIMDWMLKSKYIAMCEGDDYWTDEHKLDRQVEFLETHPQHSALAENAIEYFTETGNSQLFSEEPARDITIPELIEKRRFATASILYRSDVADLYYKVKHAYDTMLWCILASNGKLYYNAVVSSVYRRGPGVTRTMDFYAFAKKEEDWINELNQYFHEHFKPKQIETIIVNNYVIAANRYWKQKRWNHNILLCYRAALTTDWKLTFKAFYTLFILLAFKKTTKILRK